LSPPGPDQAPDQAQDAEARPRRQVHGRCVRAPRRWPHERRSAESCARDISHAYLVPAGHRWSAGSAVVLDVRVRRRLRTTRASRLRCPRRLLGTSFERRVCGRPHARIRRAKRQRRSKRTTRLNLVQTRRATGREPGARIVCLSGRAATACRLGIPLHRRLTLNRRVASGDATAPSGHVEGELHGCAGIGDCALIEVARDVGACMSARHRRRVRVLGRAH
jgi:hypothetical protein